MTTESDDSTDTSSEADKPLKKCPVCYNGVIEFEGAFVEAWGDCNNGGKHEDKYAGFEVMKLEPFTVKYEQEPLRIYTIPARIPWVITENGLKFSVRDATDSDNFRDAVLDTLEGLSDWMSSVVDSLEWEGVDWDEYEEEDDGITEYVLNDLDSPK
jgi:hypothetical protein